MTKVFQVAMFLFWILYFILMYKLYLVMEEKIPEYIRTEVMRGHKL